MRCFLISLLAFLVTSCDGPSQHLKEELQNNQQPILIAYIFPSDSIVIVEEGYQDTILMSDYFVADQENLYFTSSGSKHRDSLIPLRRMTIRNLTLSDPVFNPWDIFKEGSPKKIAEGFMSESVPYDSLRHRTAFKLYWRSKCNRIMPGFAAPCMATFGPHRRFGKFMNWQVQKHKKCGPGKFFCLEKQQDVGLIRYYQTPGCLDTFPRIKAIKRFACK